MLRIATHSGGSAKAHFTPNPLLDYNYETSPPCYIGAPTQPLQSLVQNNSLAVVGTRIMTPILRFYFTPTSKPTKLVLYTNHIAGIQHTTYTIKCTIAIGTPAVGRLMRPHE